MWVVLQRFFYRRGDGCVAKCGAPRVYEGYSPISEYFRGLVGIFYNEYMGFESLILSNLSKTKDVAPAYEIITDIY